VRSAQPPLFHGLTIVVMEGEYSHEWAELRKLRKRMLILAIALFAWMLSIHPVNFLVDRLSPAFAFGWFAIYPALILMLFVTVGEHTLWPCPRCGQPFHEFFGTFWRWVNPFTRRCLNCGLQKWVESDPEPKLKRALNPFRTDSLLKLNDR